MEFDTNFYLEWQNLSYVPRKKVTQKRSLNIFKGSQEVEVRVLDNGMNYVPDSDFLWNFVMDKNDDPNFLLQWMAV